MTVDGGTNWTRLALPHGVRPGRVATVTARAGQGVWLTVPHGRGVHLYSHALATASRWHRVSLTPHPQWSMTEEGPPNESAVVLGPGPLVSAIIGWGLSMSTGQQQLFVSADDGATFRREPLPDTLIPGSFAALDEHRSVVVTGPSTLPDTVSRTSDDGAHWTTVTMPRLAGRWPSAPTVAAVDVDHGVVRLPVELTHRGGAVDEIIEHSSDHGSTFTATRPLHIPASLSAGDPQPALAGRLIWLPERGRLYESRDGGRSWRTVRTATRYEPESIGLIDEQHAIGVVSQNGCRGYKTDCYSRHFLVRTSDAGRTWQPLRPH